MADEPTNTEQKEPVTPTTPAATQPDAEKTQAPTGEDNPDGKKPEKTLTQEEFEDALKKRLAREDKKREELETQLKELSEFRTQVETEKKKREDDLAAKELERATEKGEYEKVIKLKEEQYETNLKARAEALAKIEAERNTLRAELEKTKIDNALYAEASKLAVDPADVVQLIKAAHQIALDPKTQGILVDGDSDTSLEQIVRAFLDKKPHLAKSDYAGKSGAGSPAAKPTSGGKTTYTREQIANPDFFAANKADILQASVEGRIKS